MGGRPHGAQQATRLVVAGLSSLDSDPSIQVLDTSGPDERTLLRRLTKRLRDAIRLTHRLVRSDATALYYVPSSGFGLVQELITLFFIRFSKIRRVCIHHHSMSYLRTRRQRRLRAIRLLLPSARLEIALCRCMLDAVTHFTPTTASKVSFAVVSNAGLLRTRSPTLPSRPRPERLRVLFLANLTAEKGARDVLDLAEGGVFGPSSGLRLSVAGPAGDSAANHLIEALTSNPGWGDYRGPVYGEEKDQLLASTDILILPTRYAPEAEPLVLWEAAQAGALPIGYRRGCVGEMVAGLGLGQVLDDRPGELAEILARYGSREVAVPPRPEVRAAFNRVAERSVAQREVIEAFLRPRA